MFVHREPQQIFMGVNTEYWANLVKARVHVPITLLYIYWVCQYNPFLISKAERRLLNLENCHWNIIISNSNTVFSRFVLDSDFGFKYFLEIVCTKITV